MTEQKYMIYRLPVLPEDEGRHELIGVFNSEHEATEWIKKQKDEYFKPSDYKAVPCESGS